MPSFGGRLKYTRSHPNIIQIYGAASSGDIYATVFHDGAHLAWNVLHLVCFILEAEFVPFRQFVDGYRYSHFATVYFYACCVGFRCIPSIASHLSKECGLRCRNIFTVVEVPDARAGSEQSFLFHISKDFREFIVRLRDLFNILIRTGTSTLRGYVAQLAACVWSSYHPVPPAWLLLSHCGNIALAQTAQSIGNGGHDH
jgi:hypothetical protein